MALLCLFLLPLLLLPLPADALPALRNAIETDYLPCDKHCPETCCIAGACQAQPLLCLVGRARADAAALAAAVERETNPPAGKPLNSTCTNSTECAAGCCRGGLCAPADACAARRRPGGLGAFCRASTPAQCQSGCCYRAKCADAAVCFGEAGSGDGAGDLPGTASGFSTTTSPTTTETPAAIQTTTTTSPAPPTEAPPSPPPDSPVPPELLDPTYLPNHLRLISAEHWCLMMPDDTSRPLGESEQTASIRCSPAMVALSGGRLRAMPSGAIVTSHFSTGGAEGGDEWVQMGGGFDAAAVPLFPGDSGGQFDSDGIADPAAPDLRGSPRGSGCAGYDRYVEMIGPTYRNYCVRCCKGPNADQYCNWRLSGQSCEVVMPGIQIEPKGI